MSFVKELVRTIHTLTIIGDTMHKIEGFQYAISLDLSMGYYAIYIFPHSNYRTNIVTKFVKLRRKQIPVVMGVLGDIFQAKRGNIIVDI